MGSIALKLREMRKVEKEVLKGIGNVLRRFL